MRRPGLLTDSLARISVFPPRAAAPRCTVCARCGAVPRSRRRSDALPEIPHYENARPCCGRHAAAGWPCGADQVPVHQRTAQAQAGRVASFRALADRLSVRAPQRSVICPRAGAVQEVPSLPAWGSRMIGLAARAHAPDIRLARAAPGR